MQRENHVTKPQSNCRGAFAEPSRWFHRRWL